MIFFLLSDQRWKLDGKKLKNKAELWKSDDLWIFKPKDNDSIYGYIENTSKSKVLRAANDGTVIQEAKKLKSQEAVQLWKKGELDAEDYFTLENFGVPKVLTAISETISESGMEIKGNTTLRWILYY